MELSHNAASIMVGIAVVVTIVTGQAIPAPSFSNPYEENTNQTIDQIITNSLGGTNEAANQILDFGENILAELDMFLTKDQFLNMYQPPAPDEMYAMGMMPAPLGTEYDPKRKNFFAPPQRKKRKAARDTTLRWTTATMPYTFANGHFESKEEYMMRRAMTEWERYTCVTFRPARDTDENSTYFQNGVGCNSQLGMVGGRQMLNLQAPGCRFKGLYLHEIGHALGLVHEHQLPNRDQHIRILYHNVSPHMRIWFNKYTVSQVNQMDVPYQLSSVMHYGVTAFSKDAKSQTIEALDRNKEKTIGRVYLKELAYTDAAIVNKMYACADHCPDQEKCGPRGHLDQNCNCICEDGSSDCDKTKGPRTDNCRNDYDSWSCYIWANQGECERNEFYMHKYCAKACHKCDGDSDKDNQDVHFSMTWPWQWMPSFAQMLPSDLTMLGSCKDVYEQSLCEMWRGRGDCVTNPGWMKRNCKASCNLCRGNQRPEINCEDSHSDQAKCKKWALEGECQVNPVWMFTNCRKSCQYCHKTETDFDKSGGGVDEDKLECKDTHKNCQVWSKGGECQSNPNWMIANCRKACQKCDDGQCKNLFDDTQCQIWEQKMECLSNRKWMSRNCAKSCTTGPCAGSTETTTVTDRTKPVTSRPKVTTSSSCKNRHNSDTQCEIWAKNGHCGINPSWMFKNCAKACGRCDGDQGSRTTTPKSTKVTDSSVKTLPDCDDANNQCAAWAKHGFCDTNPRYNLIYCKKSCNNCIGCRDTELLCSVWAEAGHCSQNPRYMLRKCQKSCQACKAKKSDLELRPSTLGSKITTSAPNGNGSILNSCSLVLIMMIQYCLVLFRH